MEKTDLYIQLYNGLYPFIQYRVTAQWWNICLHVAWQKVLTLKSQLLSNSKINLSTVSPPTTSLNTEQILICTQYQSQLLDWCGQTYLYIQKSCLRQSKHLSLVPCASRLFGMSTFPPILVITLGLYTFMYSYEESGCVDTRANWFGGKWNQWHDWVMQTLEEGKLMFRNRHVMTNNISYEKKNTIP